ncbi:MAG: hypothetical protein U9N54_08915, partial [candidate division Zixibacteria bacterium]|nr:hypothetical protein [candidate division Zixibacteria bacterium]
AGIKTLTNILFTIPKFNNTSKAMRILDEQGIIKFQSGNKHMLELTFDNFKNNKTIEAYPELPLNIKY